MLKINFSHQSEKFLKKAQQKHAKQIAQKIMSLRENPYPTDYKKLKNSVFLGVDSGEYRIIYSIEDKTLFIIIVGKRNDDDVYRKLKRVS